MEATLKYPIVHASRQIGGRSMGKDGGSKNTEGGEEAPNTLKSKQVARVIDLLCEGPIFGIVDANGDLNIRKGTYYDGVVVQRSDDVMNFSNPNIQFRSGTQSQTMMTGFTSEEAPEGVGLQLFKKSVPIVRNIINTDFDRCRITVSIPTLQKVDKENGNTYGTEVQFRIELQNNGGGWAKIGDYTISGKTTSTYQRSYTFNLPKPGPWNIRLSRLTADSESQYLMNDIYWDDFTAILDDKVAYANSAVVGTIIDAEQFRAIPKRTYDVKGLLIRYPNNMDPDTGTYDVSNGVNTGTPQPWDGSTFAFGWCNNPAWVLYDLIYNGRYGIGDYLPASMLDKWSFYKAGVFCDQRVWTGKYNASGVKTYERRYVCNITIRDRQEAYDLLNQMASIFRGFTYWSGGQLVLVADQPESPVDIYTNANAIDGVFSYSGTDLRSRHTQVTIGWNDPRQLGESRLAVVEDQDAISRLGLMTAQEMAYGCTSESQAIRHGKWTLYTENYEDDSISFSTGLNGAYLRPGSIIKVMDVNVAGKRRGGRVGAGTTHDDIYFDAPLAVTAGQVYQISCLIVTDEDTSSVQMRGFTAATSGTITYVHLGNGFSRAPAPDSVFVVTAEDILEATLWRVINIKQDGIDKYDVSGVRHYPEKWDYVEKNIAFSEPDVSDISAKPPAVTNAKVIEYLVQTSSISLQVMATFSWSSLSPLFDVNWHRVGDNWHRERTDQHAINLAVTAGEYQFQVTPIGTLGLKGPMTQVNKAIIGLTAPPLTPTGFRITIIGSVAMFKWNPATEIDVRVGGKFELRFSPQASGAVWNTAQIVLTSIPGTATSAESTYQAGTWMLRVFDIDGRPSPSWATIIGLAADSQYVEFLRIEEHPDWAGVHDGTDIRAPQDWLVIGPTGGLWDSQTTNMSTWPEVDLLDIPVDEPTPEPRGVYTFYHSLDAGGAFSVRLSADVLAFPFYENADTVDERDGAVDTWLSWDDAGTDLYGEIQLEIRMTLDDPLSPTAIWSDWARFVTGEYFGRAWNFRAILTAPLGQNIGVETLSITGDFINKFDAGQDVVYNANQMRIYFRVKFYTIPAIVVTVQNALSTDKIIVSNDPLLKTREYFTLEILDTGGGHPINTRTFDWHAQGY